MRAPLVLPPYLGSLIIGLVVLAVFGLLWILAAPAVKYDRGEFLKSPEVVKIRTDLAAGRSESARSASLKLEEEMWWYSGIPSAIVAATYLQEHFEGDEGALERAGGYAQKAYDREECHITQYYLGIYYYEINEFVLSEELLTRAYTGFIRRRAMDNAPKIPPHWLESLLALLNAAKDAESKRLRVDLRELNWKFLL